MLFDRNRLSCDHRGRFVGLPLRDQGHHTYREYLSWPDQARYELIEGRAYAMGPAPARIHQEVVFELARQVADALDRGPCRVYVAPFDVRLPGNDEADDDVSTVVQPDISVICDPAKLDDKGCRGAPDWVVEVISPNTAAHDQIIKRDIYEAHKVRELWLVHPIDRLVMIYRLADGRYGKPDAHELQGTLPSGIFPEVVVSWARVFRE